jgi:hypothetical protein
LTVVRAGKEIPVELSVSPKRAMVTPDLGNAYPSYFIYGPLVFSTATDQYVRSLVGSARGARWVDWMIARGSPLITRLGDRPAFPGEELVVVPSPFFPHKLAEGYMALVKPFAALRPKPELASQICELPYDVMSSDEARAMAAGNPLSFLHVSKPEIDLPPGTDVHAPEVYAKGGENFQKLIRDGALKQDAQPWFLSLPANHGRAHSRRASWRPRAARNICAASSKSTSRRAWTRRTTACGTSKP